MEANYTGEKLFLPRKDIVECKERKNCQKYTMEGKFRVKKKQKMQQNAKNTHFFEWKAIFNFFLLCTL